MPASSAHPEILAPTVVLVHGAFTDSSSWNGVVSRLRREGLRVRALANPLRGLGSDAAYLRSVVDHIDGPVVVVGHSYGGSVMGEALEGAANVRALVYIASFQLEPGESTSELAGRFPGGRLGDALEPVLFSVGSGREGDDLYIRQDAFAAVFAADVPEEAAAVMAATQRPIAAVALADTATRAAWRSIPSWTMVTLQDLAIPAASMRFMAGRAASRVTVEIEASHAVAVSQPSAVANHILDAVRATAP